MRSKQFAALVLTGALLTTSAWAQSPHSCPVINGALSCGGDGDGGYNGPTLDGIINSMLRPPRPVVNQPSPADLKERQSIHFNDQGIKAFNRGNYKEAIRFYQLAIDLATTSESVRVNKQNIGDAHAFIANAAQKRGDLEEALREVKLALQYDGKKDYSDPKFDWPAWEKDLREAIANKKIEQEYQKNGQEAANKMRTALEQLSQTMNANASPPQTAPGLDFIDSRASAKTATLTPVNPPTVDARNVPSGLPKSVEDAIPRTPAGDRVRKGFEAIQTHDWKVARAWFQDALNKDPGNPGLQRLVDLAQHMVEPQTPTDKKLSINQPIDGFKTTPQFEQQTRDLVNSSILPQYPEQLSKSKPLDEIAKETIRPDDSKFEPGIQISQDRAQQIAHYSRLQALRSEAMVHQKLITDMMTPPEHANWDALNLSQLSSWQMSYAAEVERCVCLPNAPARANSSNSDDALFLFPNER